MTDQPALTPEREQEIRRWADHPTNAVLLAEIDRLRADLATAREALEQIAEADLKTNVLTLNRIARDALNRIGEQ